MKVLFISENTLGHGSYLPRYADWFDHHPEAGVTPLHFNVLPLPPEVERRANRSIRSLRRWGWDLHCVRWRRVVSAYVAREMRHRIQSGPPDLIVVNTQSVALDLPSVVGGLPVVPCLDATFLQLLGSPWFTPSPLARLTHPWIRRRLVAPERHLYTQARMLCPWSRRAADSLEQHYGVATSRIFPMPPALPVPASLAPRHESSDRQPARLLFVGGDFRRKGGPLLLDCFRRHLADRCELDIVTETPVAAENRVRVHHGLKPGSADWHRLWDEADLFVFPSQLETFGIVLVEALAFGVPVVASETGAAREILEDGRAGWLLPAPTALSLADAILTALDQPDETDTRRRHGWEHARANYDLDRCARLWAQAMQGWTAPQEAYS